MKKAYIFFVFIFLSFSAFGQDKSQLNDMIIDGLNSFVEHFAPYLDGDTYVCKDGLPLDFPYENLSGFKVISLDTLPSSNRCFKKELKKGVRTLFVYYSLNGNHLQITVSERKVSRIKKTTAIALNSFGRYSYEYSCEKSAWELIESEFGGI